MRENESLRESERDIIPDLRLRQGGEGIQAKVVRTPVGGGADCCTGRWQRRPEHCFFRPQPLSLSSTISTGALFFFFSFCFY